MMKALYLQINHLSRMFKPEGEEGAASLKSNLDGEKAEDDARRCNSQTKYLVTLELVCSPLAEAGVVTDVEGATAVWRPSHLVLVMGAVICTLNYMVLPRVGDVIFFFSGEARLDGSLTAIAQARSPPTVNDLSSPPCGYQLQGTRGAAGPQPVSDSNPISDVTFR